MERLMPATKKTVPTSSRARKSPARRPAVKAPAVKAAAADRAPEVKPAAVKAVAAALAPAPKPVQPARSDKPRKTKLVRDSFTIPKAEYAVIDALKERAAKAGRPAKKSEVLRAGVKALAMMGDVAFLAALGAVPAIKTGRPAKA
jgi:hypothetical protein